MARNCIAYLYHRKMAKKANFIFEKLQVHLGVPSAARSTGKKKKSGQLSLHGKPTAFCLTPPDHHPDGWKVIFYRVEKFAFTFFNATLVSAHSR